jgi:hypothetical protein
MSKYDRDDRNDVTRTRDTGTATLEDRDANRDPITGAPGSHPVGTGVGAAGGGAAGAAIGAIGGPVGALIGGTIGAIAGGAAGHAVGERMDPTYDDGTFREHHRTTYGNEDTYESYQPAYQYGWTARRRTLGTDWDELDSRMEQEWSSLDNPGGMSWEEARPAARSAWDRGDERFGSMLNEEDRHWEQSYRSQDYVGEGESFDQYRPAYRYGSESRLRHAGRSWDEVEPDLGRDWESRPDRGSLTWDRAKNAVRDGWHSIERKLPGDADRDGR